MKAVLGLDRLDGLRVSEGHDLQEFRLALQQLPEPAPVSVEKQLGGSLYGFWMIEPHIAVEGVESPQKSSVAKF
jgi:hypothetical protein